MRLFRTMRCDIQFKSGVRLIFLVVISLLISLAVNAQETSESNDKTKPSLELKLTTITPSLCIDSPLKLELAITNVSDEDVTVYMSQLWNQYSYSFDDTPKHILKAGGMGISTSLLQEEIVVLRPHITLQSSHEFSLAFDFFQSAGHYTLMTHFNSIFSNKVKFELNDCGKTQKIEDQ